METTKISMISTLTCHVCYLLICCIKNVSRFAESDLKKKALLASATCMKYLCIHIKSFSVFLEVIPEIICIV